MFSCVFDTQQQHTFLSIYHQTYSHTDPENFVTCMCRFMNNQYQTVQYKAQPIFCDLCSQYLFPNMGSCPGLLVSANLGRYYVHLGLVMRQLEGTWV